ncbi:hypothetical protein CLV92_101303 [Kineococcus xinjiangensis]|uniref:DUF8129 domain-containing protein n=1 Tax=Kineococcus xinjiangensis TaxID=512762 RepID=A0A2S6IW71_9ACTN|nr:hypothetical protein [Kineococcus xinjiangensis]PPK98604.1 hypothetical protein CLV92_101303 [Kineococcus xinjiangensis]
MTDDRAALPLPDYDHLPVATLGDRIRSLDADALGTLIAYEEEHGAREPVLTILRARAGQLAQGAEPSGGDPTAATPETAGAPSGPLLGESGAPPMNPPSHGVPTNPAQPRR